MTLIADNTPGAAKRRIVAARPAAARSHFCHSNHSNHSSRSGLFRLLHAGLLLALGLLALPAAADAPPAGVIVFAAGKATVAGQPAAVGAPLRAGDEIVTGADAHVYVRTVDDGYLILRPGSRARVAAWHIDSADPTQTRVRIELDAGVARSITGSAVKAARQNFRFNTPLAAIGVRGTDFTVFTSPQMTRIAVQSGGIVASPFDATCAPSGAGPCEGAASLTLLAEQSGLLMQIEQGRARPQLLPINGNSPDSLAPPHPDESSIKSSVAAQGEPPLEPQRSGGVLTAAPEAKPVPPRTIHWGRWRDIAASPANLDLSAILAADGELLALNSWFAVLRGAGPDWQKPATGSMNFKLAGGEAWIVNQPSGAMQQAQFENASLRVDFAKSSFSTGFDLVSQQGERHAFQALGQIGRDGSLFGDSQFKAPTNMAVSGALGGANGGSAAYIFQGRIDQNRLATGVTAWQR